MCVESHVPVPSSLNYFFYVLPIGLKSEAGSRFSLSSTCIKHLDTRSVRTSNKSRAWTLQGKYWNAVGYFRRAVFMKVITAALKMFLDESTTSLGEILLTSYTLSVVPQTPGGGSCIPGKTLSSRTIYCTPLKGSCHNAFMSSGLFRSKPPNGEDQLVHHPRTLATLWRCLL